MTTSDASETGAGIAEGRSIHDGHLHRNTINGIPDAWFPGTTGETMRCSVDASAVLEPGRGALLLSCLGVVLRRRRK